MEIQSLLLPAAALGTGLAIDVSIATIARYRDTSLSFFNWTLPIAAYHVAFQAIGFLLFWEFLKEYPYLGPVVGVAGFLLVFALVYEILCKMCGVAPKISISHLLAAICNINETDSRRLIVQIAVSLDALVSGPATSMVAKTMSLQTTEALLLFALAGIVVATVTHGVLLVSRRLALMQFSSIGVLAYWFTIGTFVELSVIGGFGILSLWAGVSQAANLYVSIGIAAFLLTLFFILNWSNIFSHEYEEAKEMIDAKL